MQQTVRVEGLRELIRAADNAGKETKKLVRGELRKAAEPVRDEARRLFAPVDAKSASRYGISVRRSGIVSVEQRLRKTTGLHPEFGALQMRTALEPALDSKADEVGERMEAAVDRIGDGFAGRL